MIPYSQLFYCLDRDGNFGIDNFYHFENLTDLMADRDWETLHYV